MHEGCTTAARGKYSFCIAHGCGGRCTYEGCTKGAAPGSGECIAVMAEGGAIRTGMHNSWRRGLMYLRGMQQGRGSRLGQVHSSWRREAMYARGMHHARGSACGQVHNSWPGGKRCMHEGCTKLAQLTRKGRRRPAPLSYSRGGYDVSTSSAPVLCVVVGYHSVKHTGEGRDVRTWGSAMRPLISTRTSAWIMVSFLDKP
jgi:hypothetical protein